jgi:hypothetical protein
MEMSSSDLQQRGSSSERGMTRNVLVHITGNRATWEHMGMHGALWRVNSERAGVIFGCDGQNPSDSTLNDKLSRAMIHSVTVLESNTNIDEIVSIQVDGLPPKEFTSNGDGASFFLTGEGKVSAPQEIFNMSGNTELGLAWMKQYPTYTSANLENEGVMRLPGASYYFVHIEHPAIHLLKANETELGVHICEESRVPGRLDWHQVDTEAFVYCIKMLRENVLQNTPSTFNLSGLTVRISKPDGQRWLQLGPHLVDSLVSDEVRETNDSDLIAEARRQGVQRYIDKPLFVTLRLSFEYSLPETSLAAKSSCGSMVSGAILTSTTTTTTTNNNNNNNYNNNNNNGR